MNGSRQFGQRPLRAIVLGGGYFAVVFAVGFALGVVRVLWLVPRLGERYAELAETPVMIGASFLAARILLNRCRPAPARQEAVVMGVVGLALLLVFEFTVVLAVRGLSLAEYVASRDPVAGSAYLLALVLFALMPSLVTGFGRQGGWAGPLPPPS